MKKKLAIIIIALLIFTTKTCLLRQDSHCPEKDQALLQSMWLCQPELTDSPDEIFSCIVFRLALMGSTWECEEEWIWE